MPPVSNNDGPNLRTPGCDFCLDAGTGNGCALQQWSNECAASISGNPYLCARHGYVVVTKQHPTLRGVRMTNYRMVKPLKVQVIEIRRDAASDSAGMAPVHVEA